MGFNLAFKGLVFVCTASDYRVSKGPISFPGAIIFSCILVQVLRVFFDMCLSAQIDIQRLAKIFHRV